MRHTLAPLFRKIARLAWPASVLLALAPAANAVTVTTTFQVTATVLNACLLSTPPTLAFGTYDPASATPLAGTTTFNVTCTFGTPYSIGLSAGASAGATVDNRAMTSPTAPAGNNTLLYGLYKESTYSTNWDNSVSGTGYTGNGVLQPLTVYGQIPINQYTAAAATDYADTITLTLTY
ncbi:Csu type fimbrial protein [Variovorax boronicumulans]|uniref:Csu type fimbrial protein n=1 Tax=Variovorax boronicumulans TaxID=436515 RepID=UPI003391DBCE